jgi:hypothetical protein
MLKTVGLVAASLFGATAVSNPEEYVNILGGTDSRYDLSNGNTLPLVTVPWGFNVRDRFYCILHIPNFFFSHGQQ